MPVPKDQNQISLDQLSSDHENGLSHIYKEHREAFIAYCRKYNFSQDLSLEAYHDAVLVFYNIYKSGKYDPQKASIKTLIFGIGKKKLLDKIRKEQKFKSIVHELEMEVNHFHFQDNNQEKGDYKEALDRAMDQISESCRQLIVLFYYHRYSIDSIQREMGHANNNVTKSHKSRCLKKLSTIYKTIKI